MGPVHPVALHQLLGRQVEQPGDLGTDLLVVRQGDHVPVVEEQPWRHPGNATDRLEPRNRRLDPRVPTIASRVESVEVVEAIFQFQTAASRGLDAEATRNFLHEADLTDAQATSFERGYFWVWIAQSLLVHR